jgi:hypothetical protein
MYGDGGLGFEMRGLVIEMVDPVDDHIDVEKR